ncbi:hypothetical protein B566_EDAN003663 [Ephemera danica]|nr:hypothetical protein B566_EDAN003663 [Ephemera danica]
MENIASPSEVYEKAEDFSSITGGDSELEKKLRILCLEHEVLRQEGCLVPSSLTLDQWKQIFAMDTRSKRRKYYRFLFGVEVKRRNEKLKKQQRAQEFLEKKQGEVPEEENGHIKYGIGHNTFLLRIYDTTMNQLYNNNVIRAMQFGQKLVIDCGYDEYMIPQETSNCAKQLMLSFSENRMHTDPFDIYLCNANKDSPTIKQLNKFIPNMYEDYFPLNISEKSYLDVFPRKDLVYLTPHCRTELQEFDHNAVYVIGGMVDKVNCEPLSLAKAKREGLCMAKLPLDTYLQWGGGSGKSLTINQMVSIMLDMHTSEDWKFALRHVPRRKLFDQEPIASQPKKSMDNSKPFRTRERKQAYTKIISPHLFDLKK